MQRPGSASDPLWFKDAVIYEVPVRGFFDSNNDGVGDLRGLIEKLDYIHELGVTCIWLLPFFPSPLRDDGYDIADYVGVHPNYGTLADFSELLDAAHARGLQVMIELVINHTSDKHPWFQAARRAPPGSPAREYYVWSDTDQRYAGTRIIFTDTEKSNWSWDAEAKAFYWHRFFSHQPDLNFDNPAVVEEVLRVMRFWLDLGVDALRLDAIPYLVERDGTSCENLPETHAVIKEIRAVLDREYAGRVLLAEANQWPRDVRAYFGDGDECHMAFHFPLMPRLFMALRLEDRHPVTEIMAQTPVIPESCQWGLFLRNHDELTLEMVSDDERDYMYLAYSADPLMRINVGIRRRLAPLVENNRSRIELLNSILLSFPGTPILYCGDEIGMGDNIYLGDRNSVRTPMQWSGDRNGGFSRATPARLYSPVIMDPVYGYQAVNVEAQRGEPSSLLNWTRRMLALRKLFQVFGRGSIEFLAPTNRKILAYLRRYEGEQVLCVANLSRFAQPFELDLSSLAGMTPIEMLGYVEFPRITERPYPLTLGPYASLWFELHRAAPPAASEAGGIGAFEAIALEPDDQWQAVFGHGGHQTLTTEILPRYLARQSWFIATGRPIDRCRIEDWIPLGETFGLAVIDVEYLGGGGPDRYGLVLRIAVGAEGERLRESVPASILGVITRGHEDGVIHDGLESDDVGRELFGLVQQHAELAGAHGRLAGSPDTSLDLTAADPELPVARRSGTTGGLAVIYGNQYILKLVRHLEPGPDPDVEITRYLTERRGFSGVPRLAGLLEYRTADGAAATVARLQGFVTNQGDGWTWTLEELARYYERAIAVATGMSPAVIPDPWVPGDSRALPVELDELLGVSDDAAAALGKRTAEMHLALAEPTDNLDFAPEPLSADDFRSLAARIRVEATSTFELLRRALPQLSDEQVEGASRVLSYRGRVLDRITPDEHPTSGFAKTRIHGDYHLGHVLRTGQSFVITGFEGEPARPLELRRAKQSPLRDVATMLRSFAYVSRAAFSTYVARHPRDFDRAGRAAVLWEQSTASVFLREYRRATAGASFLAADQPSIDRLLKMFLLEKALAELRHELTHRPDWVHVPVAGVIGLLE